MEYINIFSLKDDQNMFDGLLKKFIDNKLNIIFICILIILLSTLITLFRHWEPTHETWGYWLASRIFVETGKVNILERSPLYVMYLSIFQWINFPNSVITEYIVTTFFTSIMLFFFLMKDLGIFISLIATILWIPFMQDSEPPVQKFALAFACLAFIIRRNGYKWIPLFYFVIGIACLFRPTYLYILIFILLKDIWLFFKNKKMSKQIMIFFLRRLHYFIFFFILIIYFVLNQSRSNWNNQFFATSRWFPWTGKKFEALQNYNWYYIEKKYGTFVNQDFHFSNKELFRNAPTTVQAFINNPRFIQEFTYRNTLTLSDVFTSHTLFPYVYKYFNIKNNLNIFITILLLYGALRCNSNRAAKLFIIGNIIILIVTLPIFLPFPRYMFPLIIIMPYSACFYSYKFLSLLQKYKFKINNNYRVLSTVIIILFFSNGLVFWKRILFEIQNDLENRTTKIMEKRNKEYDSSLKASYTSIVNLSQKCHGLMSLDHSFIGAFSIIPLSNIYDVWEIPPFGFFDKSDYSGLQKDRINCLFISNELTRGVGAASNYQIRYDNYIKPFKTQLLELGAGQYKIPSYGEIIILNI